MKPVRFALVLVAALVLQTSLVADLRLFGATGDLMVLVAVAGGLAGGPQRGALVGFAAGITLDLVVQTPFGLSALAYCLTGYAVGTLQGSVLRAAWWIPVLSAVAGSALGVALFVAVGEMVGQESLAGPRLPAIMLVVALLNGLLALPAVRAVRWALSDPVRVRAALR